MEKPVVPTLQEFECMPPHIQEELLLKLRQYVYHKPDETTKEKAWYTLFIEGVGLGLKLMILSACLTTGAVMTLRFMEVIPWAI